MFNRDLFIITIAGIMMVGLGSFLIIYGITGGLIKNKILI